MINIIIGNIIGLIASLLMVYSGLIKKKEKIIYIQTIQKGMAVIGNIILCGITGAITNAVGCIRNILCYKNKFGNKEKIIIVIISIILSLRFNNFGIIGMLPLISTVIYTLLMDMKDVIKFKKMVIVTMVMWYIYDVCIKSYTSAIFDCMNIIANAISIHKLKYPKIEKRI